MTAHRIAALGAERASLALRTVEPLLRPIETEYFYDRDFVTAKASALASLLSGGTRVGLRDLNIPDAPNAISATIAASVPQPFLFLKVDWLGDGTDVSYFSELDRANSRHNLQGKILQVGDFSRGYGASRNLQRMSGVTLRLEDFDRAIATRVRAKVSVNGSSVGKYTQARFYFSVGEPVLTEDYYTSLTCPFMVERATVDETSVEFSLIDASQDATGAMITVPTVNSLKTSFTGPNAATRKLISGFASNNGSPPSQYSGWRETTLDSAFAQDPDFWTPQSSQTTTPPPDKITLPYNLQATVPVPFGNAIFKSPLAWCSYRAISYETAKFNNPVAFVVLGASKNPGWMKPHFWGDCELHEPSAADIRNEPKVYLSSYKDSWRSKFPLLKAAGDGTPGGIIPSGKNSGVVGYIDVTPVVVVDGSRDSNGNPVPWYVAVLYLAIYGWGGGIGFNGRQLQGFDANGRPYPYTDTLSKMAKAVANDGVWVDMNGSGASGTWGAQAEKQVAAQVMGYLSSWHVLDRNGFPLGVGSYRGENRILDNYDDALTADGQSGSVVGGVITQNVSVSQIVDDLCDTTGLDRSFTGAGRIALRPTGITARDRALAIPRARQLTDNDIIDGTWKEEAPRGDDRWGYGDLFRFSGLQTQLTVEGYTEQSLSNLYGGDPRNPIERRVNISWWRQDPDQLINEYGTWTLPYRTERQTVAFDVHFSAASGLELGEYVYITYYAGSNSDGTKGWNRKLCRLEGLDVRWEQQQVGVRAVVFQYQYQQQILLDDENRWTLFQPVNLDTLTFVAGSPNVTFNPAAGTQDRVAASWVGCTIKVSPSFNPKPYPAPDYATYVPAAATVFSSKIQSITDQLHFVMANNAPANATVYAWRVKYTHITPPPAARFGGLLATDPADASPWTKYLQLADLGTGAFSNGDPAQRFQGP